MIIRKREAVEKAVRNMLIRSYPVNGKFSASRIAITGRHGKLKCLKEDRIYYILDGKGTFWVDGKEAKVKAEDLVFVPKETPYDIEGELEYLLVCSPAFDAKDDIVLE